MMAPANKTNILSILDHRD